MFFHKGKPKVRKSTAKLYVPVYVMHKVTRSRIRYILAYKPDADMHVYGTFYGFQNREAAEGYLKSMPETRQKDYVLFKATGYGRQ